MSRVPTALATVALLALAACAAPAQVSSEGIAVDPTPQAADQVGPPVEAPAATEPVDGGLDGGEPPAVDAVEYGPGLGADEIVSLVQPLADAEAWLAELEVQWDNGMTYSEIFRAWRSVSAETGPVLATFAVPDAADEVQADLLTSYYESVQGAHDEWQSTVDFIVTYITNYTPEILITKAYQEVEVHLRHAAAERDLLGVDASESPTIVVEELVDL